MKWLLIFIVMSMDTPIYLEFESAFDCTQAGISMQKQFMDNNSSKSVSPPYNTFTCVEQE